MHRRLFAVSRGTLLIAGPRECEDHAEWLTKILGPEEAARVVRSEYRGHYSIGEVYIYVGEGYREVRRTTNTVGIVRAVAGALGVGHNTQVYSGVAGDQWRSPKHWGEITKLEV